MGFFVDIEKNYKGFSLRVEMQGDGDSVGILGASGSGKSMTLKCIAGIVTPDKGKIIVNGRTVFDSEAGINMKPQERRIGYLFQNYALFPTMNVRDNIGCGYLGPRKMKGACVEEHIRRYRLEGLQDRLPAQLSGGQQQRVALARMMIGEPEMILLDEPFSALDSYLKDILQRDMQEYLRTYSGDMILVTHSRDEAYRFCRKLLLLGEGRNLIAGQTRQLFENPQILEAARLTGCKNYSAIERIDEHHIYALDWGLTLRTEQSVKAEHRYVGIRGHWIESSSENVENCMPAEVTEMIETTFEHQCMVRNPQCTEGTPIWWMRPKRSFSEEPCLEHLKYLRLPAEHLMLLTDQTVDIPAP